MEQIPSNTPVMESKPGPAGWLAVWIKAVTKPNEQTFVEITESPNATLTTAFIWVFIAGVVSGIFQAIRQAFYSFNGGAPQIPGFEQYMPATGDTGVTATSLIITLCASPFFAMLGFAIVVAITQWIAKLFKGTGNFEKLAYAWAAISLPLTLVTSFLSLLGLIPVVGYCTGVLSLILFFYYLYLEITAVKAVNRFAWGPAVASVLIPIVVVFSVCFCVIFAGALIFGAAIGDVFSGINQSLAP
jgi:hypothetical protein